jgi:hypothetical protein
MSQLPVHRSQLVRLGVGVLLLGAAALKFHQLMTTPDLGRHLILSIGLIQAESFLGLWSLSGLWVQSVRRTSLFLFTIFSIVSAYKAITGTASCGCFGAVGVSPWLVLGLDIGVIALLVTAPPRAYADESGLSHRILIGAISTASFWFVMASASTVAVVNFQISSWNSIGRVLGDGRTVVLDPAGWVGKPFPLRSWIDTDSLLDRGHWTIVLHRTGCTNCEQLIDSFEQGGVSFGDTSIAFVDLEECAGLSKPIRRADISACLSGKYSWLTNGPWEVRLHDGTVVSARMRLS